MVFKKKCSGCAKKIDKKFSYCPYCGMSFKRQKEEDEFGMIGRDDMINSEALLGNDMKLPFGLDKMMNGLMKQLEKQFSEMEKQSGVQNSGMPRGFKIQISTGKPRVNGMNNSGNAKKEIVKEIPVSLEELERRRKLPKTEAGSKIRRLNDLIVYEVSVPGVNGRKDVVITKLEEGLEVKAYSKDRCYYKSIPLKVEIIGWYLQDEKIFVELKG